MDTVIDSNINDSGFLKLPVVGTSLQISNIYSMGGVSLTPGGTYGLTTSSPGTRLYIPTSAWGEYTEGLPYILRGLIGTTSINTASDITVTFSRSVTAYYLRRSGWSAVSSTGWTRISSGGLPVSPITGYDNTEWEIYKRSYSAGTYTFDTFSAMYFFDDGYEGLTRFNVGNDTVEYYTNNSWYRLDGAVWADSLYEEPGSQSDVVLRCYTGEIVDDSQPYKTHIHLYDDNTGVSSFHVRYGGEIEYMLVAGGGGGGSSDDFSGGGGGGGAGGVISGRLSVDSGEYGIVVGNGADSYATTDIQDYGDNTTAFGLTAIGGGSGSINGISGGTSGGDGGSGGGAFRTGYTSPRPPGTGVPGQGNDGGNAGNIPSARGGGGGGGGARAVGGDGIGTDGGGNGGAGILTTLSGGETYLAGGGGGGSDSGAQPGEGGIGGGSRGSTSSEVQGVPGGTHTGGGGGGGSSDSSGTNYWQSGRGGRGGRGGSGQVVIRYPYVPTNTYNTGGSKGWNTRREIADIPTEGLLCYMDAAASWDPYDAASGPRLLDLSGNGNHFGIYSGTVAAATPAYEYRGYYGGVIYGNSVSVYNNLNLSSGQNTVITASRYAGSPRGRIVNGRSNNWLLGHWSDTTENYYAAGWVSPVDDGGTDDKWRILAATGDTARDQWELYVNGDFKLANSGGSQGPNGIAIGSYTGNGTSEPSQWEVGFILAYNRVLGPLEIRQVYDAMRGRFGL